MERPVDERARLRRGFYAPAGGGGVSDSIIGTASTSSTFSSPVHTPVSFDRTRSCWHRHRRDWDWCWWDWCWHGHGSHHHWCDTTTSSTATKTTSTSTSSTSSIPSTTLVSTSTLTSSTTTTGSTTTTNSTTTSDTTTTSTTTTSNSTTSTTTTSELSTTANSTTSSVQSSASLSSSTTTSTSSTFLSSSSSSSTLSSTSTAATTTLSSSADQLSSSATSASTSSGVSRNVIIGVSAAGVGVVFILAAVALFLFRRRCIRKRKRRISQIQPSQWISAPLAVDTLERDAIGQLRLRNDSIGRFGGNALYHQRLTSPHQFSPPAPYTFLQPFTLPSPPAPPSAYIDEVPTTLTSETPVNASATVLYTYVPTLPDELRVTVGDRLHARTAFDDGWCLCVNAQGERGMVPMECLDIFQDGSGSRQSRATEGRLSLISRRDSSTLGGAPNMNATMASAGSSANASPRQLQLTAF